LKKRTKKLLLALVRAGLTRRVNQRAKVFCFFFSKKKYFLASLACQPQRRFIVGPATGRAAPRAIVYSFCG
jgi:hypothetical protein